MEPFARTIDVAKKYVVSATLDRVDWNAELVPGDLGTAVQASLAERFARSRFSPSRRGSRDQADLHAEPARILG